MAVICLPCRLNAQQKLHLLFTGDIQGYVKSENPQQHSDVLRIATATKSLLKKENISKDECLIFDTGDALSYHYLAKLDSGRTIIQTLHKAGFDGMTIGNLDFKYGRDNLERLNSLSPSFNLFSSNLLNDDGTHFLTPYKIYEKLGIKIGVFGAVNHRVEEVILAEHRKDIVFDLPKKSVEKIVAELKDKCNIIIAINHLSPDDNLQLARTVDGIDIIIGRPDRDLLDFVHVVDHSNRPKTVIVKPPRKAKSIGHVTLSFTLEAGKYRVDEIQLEPFQETTTVDESQLEQGIYQQTQALYTAYCQKKYQGLLPDKLIAEFHRHFKKNYATYALYAMLKSTHSEIAIVNNGSFRFEPADENKQSLTARDIDRINWAGEHITTMHLDGKTLKLILQRGIAIDINKGSHLRFLAIGGDLSGKITIHSKPLKGDEIYKIVTTNFLASGGDGYIEFKQGENRQTKFTGETMLNASQQPEAGIIKINELLVKFYLSDDRPNFTENQN